MLRILLVAGVTMFSTAVAQARDWLILDFRDGQCHASTDLGVASPEEFHQGLRVDGIVDSIDVVKNDAGAINYVTIQYRTDQGTPTMMFWFPSSENCELMRTVLKRLGRLPDLDELK